MGVAHIPGGKLLQVEWGDKRNQVLLELDEAQLMTTAKVQQINELVGRALQGF